MSPLEDKLLARTVRASKDGHPAYSEVKLLVKLSVTFPEIEALMKIPRKNAAG